MLWFGRRLGDFQLPRGVRWQSKMATVNGQDLREPASNVDKIWHALRNVTSRDLVRERSADLRQLGGLIDLIDNGRDMRKVRNNLHRHFGTSYMTAYCSLRNVVADPTLFEMSMFRRIGKKQYGSFVSAMRSTIADENLSKEQKRQKLYRFISFQHDIFAKRDGTSGFLIPPDINKWFWENIPREESFNHFYFLIKNDVLLSSCQNVWNFAQRLMQGSELEAQLATFEIFFHDKAHQAKFQKKFERLYCFHSMNKLVGKVLSDKDYRFIKVYLSSLLQKMESLKADRDGLDSRTVQRLFVQFHNTLLLYLAQTGNAEMFLETFEIKLNYMRQAGFLKDTKFTQEYLHRSLHFVLKMLRQKGLQDHVFQYIRVIRRVIRKRDPEFNKRIVGELVTTLRSFNDPKLTCQYVLSAFDTKRTAKLLNNLGLWAPIFHQNSGKLSDEVLNAELNAQEKMFSHLLRIKDTPSVPIMTELYRVLLSTSARTMGREEYQNFILELYAAYKNVLKERSFSYRRHDMGILAVFLHHIRLELNDSKLAFEILKDFFSQSYTSSIRCTSKACPFSLVVYKNDSISPSELSHLLHLMQLNRVPLQFRFCTAMVLRYLNLGDVEEAHSWYRKILHAGFEVSHSILIKAIAKNGWEYPKNFNTSLLLKLDQRMPYSNEDALFLGQGDDPEALSASGESSLLKAISLVDGLKPSGGQRPSI